MQNAHKYVEPTTKSRPKGLHHKHLLVDAKLYATGGERCPYALFELYKSKRPSKMQESGPMYMQFLRFSPTMCGTVQKFRTE